MEKIASVYRKIESLNLILFQLATKKNKNVEVVLITSDKSNIENIDIKKFNKEYPILKVAKTDKFHDRFIIIDNKELYHCGASIKDLGKKCFAINKIEDISIIFSNSWAIVRSNLPYY